mgnify:CR=1 FL=1
MIDWPTPNGHKVSLALEEMELDYTVKPINILTGEQHSPEFIAISPNNRVPAIVDHDGPDGSPHAIFESGAILLYLAQKYDKFWIEHGINRYCGETKRLYGLIDRRLGEQEYLAGENYSLADMATFPWMIDKQQKFHGIDVSEFTNVQRWLAAINSRPGAQRGMQVMAEDLKIGNPTEEARKAFFHRD